MMVDDETKKRAREVDPEIIAKSLGLESHRSRHKWRCPSCGSEDGSGDNLHVNPKGEYEPDGRKCAAKCFACGVTCSDAIDFVQTFGQLEFVEAVEWICAETGIPLESKGRQPSKPERGKNAAPRRLQQTPAKDRENAGDKKFEPPDVRVEIFERIWEATKPLELTEQAKRWLEYRAISPRVAHAYGCRDWYPVTDDIFAILGDNYSAKQLRLAGMVNDKGDAWWPLRAFRDNNDNERGLAIPVWHPGYPKAPVAIRWRTYSDNAYQKVYQQPSGPGRFRQPPLGLLEPSPNAYARLYLESGWLKANVPDFETIDRKYVGDHAPRTIGDYPGDYAIVFCEGETDWLSVASAAVELDTSMRIVPVGVTSMSSPWPARWTDEIESAHWWIAGFDGNNSDPDCTARERADDIRKELIARHPKGRDGINPRFKYALRPEHGDLNDLRKQGNLTNYIRANLPEEPPNE